jgi:hypothetical protein
MLPTNPFQRRLSNIVALIATARKRTRLGRAFPGGPYFDAAARPFQPPRRYPPLRRRVAETGSIGLQFAKKESGNIFLALKEAEK